jgi:nucleoside-diphosphate-sugar epimerase
MPFLPDSSPRPTILLLGGNGQVASDVVLQLARFDDVTALPVARSRGGSAFLRLNDMVVRHGDIEQESEASALLAGADLVANFALAWGTPGEMRARNSDIIENSLRHAPANASYVFLSTLAVHGEAGPDGRMQRSNYGRLKRSNERMVLRLARRLGRRAWVLRLGHVMGPHQRITHLIRSEIAEQRVRLPEPDRASNTVLTLDIAEALRCIALGLAGPPGIYDLVSRPQRSWRQVYEAEAAGMGLALSPRAPAPVAPPPPKPFARLIAAIASGPLRETGLKVAALLPAEVAARLKARHAVARSAAAVAAMAPAEAPANGALFWPAHDARWLEGPRDTADLIRAYPASAPACA